MQAGLLIPFRHPHPPLGFPHRTVGHMDVRVRTQRAERMTTSCSECRRRKQRCDQGRPCSNCLKRFPQPVCEYRQNPRRNPVAGVSNEPLYRVDLNTQNYDYGATFGTTMPTTTSMVAGPSTLVPTAHHLGTHLPPSLVPGYEQLYGAPLASPGLPGQATAMPDTTGQLGALEQWPDFDMLASTSGLFITDPTAATMMPASTMMMGGATPGVPGVPQQPMMGPASSVPMDMALFNDAHAQTMHLHQDVLQSAFHLLEAQQTTEVPPSRSMDDFYGWLRMLTWTAPMTLEGNNSMVGSANPNNYGAAAAATTGASEMGSLANLYSFNLQGTMSTLMSVDPHDGIVQKYVQLLAQFKACLDGTVDATNPYVKVYAPYCLQTPLLAQVAVYTSACFLDETGHLESPVAIDHKDRVTAMLNAHLQGRTALTSDDAVAAVVQLIMNEWYWGDMTDALQVHLQGLREMIRVRGGLRQLGMNGLVSKLVVAAIHLTAIHRSDVSVALSFDLAPYLANGADFDYQETPQVPLRVAHNTPLVAKLATFAQCAEALRMHPTTASILDDMRFLISTVLGLPAEPSENDLQKIQTTAEWIYGRIQRLPPDSPEHPTPSTTPQPNTPPRPTSGGPPTTPSIVLSTAASSSSASPQQLQQQQQQQQSQQQTILPTVAARASARRPSLSPQTATAASNHRRRRRSNSPLQSENSNSRPGSARSSRRGSPQQQSLDLPMGSTGVASVNADHLYQAVRQTALIYCRAILSRTPFDEVVSADEFEALWTVTWKVSQTSWKGLQGVFLWITLVLLSSCGAQNPEPTQTEASTSTAATTTATTQPGMSPRDRYVRSMLSVCAVQVSLEGWDVSVMALKAALRLNTWLMGDVEEEEYEEEEEDDENEE